MLLRQADSNEAENTLMAAFEWTFRVSLQSSILQSARIPVFVASSIVGLSQYDIKVL